MDTLSARTADLTQVRSTPPTCKRTPHCKDSKHGGRVRRYGTERQTKPDHPRLAEEVAAVMPTPNRFWRMMT
ncbi:hypothetical protein B296_00035607, partial [Ensete ventricosum]